MKKNHLSEAAKFLIIAATILIVMALVVSAFFVMKEGKAGTNKSMSSYTTMFSEYSNPSIEMYDGLEVSGSEVRAFIKSELAKTEKIIINYKTLGDTTVTVASATTLDEVKTSKKYINPVGAFQGAVKKDDNGVVAEITFTQVKR